MVMDWITASYRYYMRICLTFHCSHYYLKGTKARGQAVAEQADVSQHLQKLMGASMQDTWLLNEYIQALQVRSGQPQKLDSNNVQCDSIGLYNVCVCIE